MTTMLHRAHMGRSLPLTFDLTFYQHLHNHAKNKVTHVHGHCRAIPILREQWMGITAARIAPAADVSPEIEIKRFL